MTRRKELKAIGIPTGILIAAQVPGLIGFPWNGFRAVGCDSQPILKIYQLRPAAAPASLPRRLVSWLVRDGFGLVSHGCCVHLG